MTGLAPEDRSLLLAVARRAIAYGIVHGAAPSAPDLGIDLRGSLEAPGPAFVTLKEGERLRGCVGRLTASDPLWRTVAEMAVGAALRDHRFASVTADELDRIAITISVLTPPRAVSSARDIEIGRHGIVLRKAGRAATFLPEVPVEHGWDLEHTLDRLARKAGLAEDGWRKDAGFEVFEAQVFSDPEAR